MECRCYSFVPKTTTKVRILSGNAISVSESQEIERAIKDLYEWSCLSIKPYETMELRNAVWINSFGVLFFYNGVLFSRKGGWVEGDGGWIENCFVMYSCGELAAGVFGNITRRGMYSNSRKGGIFLSLIWNGQEKREPQGSLRSLPAYGFIRLSTCALFYFFRLLLQWYKCRLQSRRGRVHSFRFPWLCCR